uniref:Uncharacterized protein n=1 Tax=Aegilops tauschii subsp. strangulata TaxID=200361 RepID=A0A453ICL3_AEGTS
ILFFHFHCKCSSLFAFMYSTCVYRKDCLNTSSRSIMA